MSSSDVESRCLARLVVSRLVLYPMRGGIMSARENECALAGKSRRFGVAARKRARVNMDLEGGEDSRP